MKILLLLLLLIAAKSYSVEVEKADIYLFSGLATKHIGAQTYTKRKKKQDGIHERQIKLNNNNDLIGLQLQVKKHSLSFGSFNNSYYYASDFLDYGYSLYKNIDIGVTAATGYESTSRSNFKNVAIAPTVKINFLYFVLIQSGGATTIALRLKIN